MNDLYQDFRIKLLETDIIPRKLNNISLKYKELLVEDLKNEKIKIEKITSCQCSSQNLEQLTNIDRFGLPFGSLICRDCGLVITNPRICEESLPYYYDKYYHPLNYGREDLENQTALFADGQGKKIFSILKEYLPQKKKLKILEVGAGTGNVLAEFKNEAKQYDIEIDELGTEYSQDCIKKAKKDNNINIIFGNIETVVKRREKFDIIILSHVFEHFIDLKKELENLKLLMTYDTLLYIEVPGIMVNHKKSYYDFSFLYYLTHAHMYNFTKITLSNVLSMHHISIINANEEVEVVCMLNKSKDYKIKNDYQRIINYLEFLMNNQEYFKKLNYYEKQYFSQKDTIKNREQTIKGKLYLLEKQQVKMDKLESYLSILLNSIKEMTENSIFRQPIKKFYAYKKVLKNFDLIKGQIKNDT